MAWHAEISALVLRDYDGPVAFDQVAPFRAVCTVKLLGAGEAFVEGFLARDGCELSVRDFRDLARLLRDVHGVQIIRAKRGTERVEYSTSRAGRPSPASTGD